MAQGSDLLQFERDPEVGAADAGLTNIGSSVSWLRQRLGELGVELRGDSSLAKALVDLERLKTWTLADTVLRWPKEELQQGYLRATGVDFLSKVLRRGDVAGLGSFASHYTHLASANPLVTEPHGKSAQSRNKTWELVLASLVSTFASDVKSEEPDVTCELAGRRVGIVPPQSKRDFYRLRCKEEQEFQCPRKPAASLLPSRRPPSFVVTSWTTDHWFHRTLCVCVVERSR